MNHTMPKHYDVTPALHTPSSQFLTLLFDHNTILINVLQINVLKINSTSSKELHLYSPFHFVQQKTM